MNLHLAPIEKTCPEPQIFESVLSLDNKNILELGCGDAMLTRKIASAGEGRSILATEVDRLQHDKNRLIHDLPNVNFILSGCENIPLPDNSFDAVFMFKSLHHVPVELMAQALLEVQRVLKPGGFAYISEPVFAGDFNDVLQLFHNEQAVRQAAFDAVKLAVDNDIFQLAEEIFFNNPIVFDNFEQFAQKVIGATHSEHKLSDELYAQVEEKFTQVSAANGGNFVIPIRVDLLQKA